MDSGIIMMQMDICIRIRAVEIGGYWYYFDNDGIMKANFWRKKDGDRYYYDANGHLVTNRTMVINGVTYRFSSSGKVI